MNYWLVKSEPFKYSWEDFVRDGRTYWDGVRNYQARNNLAAMKAGDLALFYHSNKGLEIVGVAKVVKESCQDPTTDDERWVVVDMEPDSVLEHPVGLKDIKTDPALKEMHIVKQSRLSVTPVLKKHFDILIKKGKNRPL
ncbi:MAG: EVE domain-containing protein [Candidatus Mycalebacterium zealandia]|nr:MAG: EVE domain-containing protein [Candidatus Mycalebacterium zealandia]